MNISKNLGGFIMAGGVLVAWLAWAKLLPWARTFATEDDWLGIWDIGSTAIIGLGGGVLLPAVMLVIGFMIWTDKI